MIVPAVQPYTPRTVAFIMSRSGQRSVSVLERPEEQCIVRVACSVDSDVPSEAAGKRPGDVW